MPRLRRPAVLALAAVRRALRHGSLVGRTIGAVEALTGDAMDVSVATAGQDVAPTLSSHTVAFALRSPLDEGAVAALEVELALMAAVVARVTKRPAPKVIHAGLATPALLGAFAAVLAAAIRQAGLPVVVASHDTSTAISSEERTVAGLVVVYGGQATHARVSFPTRILPTPSRFVTSELAGLGDLPLTLPVVLCRTVVTADDLAALSFGDVWVPGVATTQRQRWLSAPCGERAAVAEVEADGRIVLREGDEELGWKTMTEEESGPLVEAIGEVPVVVRVEVGAVTMTAREWAALAPGDVVGLASRPGDAVTLRVAGLAVAEGELVDLDGEVAVRIRRRIARGET